MTTFPSDHSIKPPRVVVVLVMIFLVLEGLPYLYSPLSWWLIGFGALDSTSFHPLPTDPLRLVLVLATLVTHAFLHGGIIHVGMNSLMMLALSPPVVSSMGDRKFLALFAITAIGGGLAQVGLPGWSPGLSVGASGAVFGIAAARSELMARASGFRVGSRWKVRIQQAIGWMLLNAAIVAVGALLSRSGALQSGIAWKAHAGGYFVGALLAPVLLRHWIR